MGGGEITSVRAKSRILQEFYISLHANIYYFFQHWFYTTGLEHCNISKLVCRLCSEHASLGQHCVWANIGLSAAHKQTGQIPITLSPWQFVLLVWMRANG